ncbi:putative C9orf72-like protein family protein [Blattamonas nauphoetae]|uniref:C9orf72-like protein family protein n=1 Tax=Blattamonas nauphoetae TaxID=2049346 RepID=A0ABQ9XBT7_9EUKA|nr:putative C9orf72-like protein family protein [Blattamonas nauphoetae]
MSSSPQDSKTIRPFATNHYVQAMLFSLWDNLLGPTVNQNWGSNVEITESDLHFIVKNVLDSHSKSSHSDDIETKIIFLTEPSYIVISGLFTGRHKSQDTRCALSLIVPGFSLILLMIFSHFYRRTTEVLFILDDYMKSLSRRLQNLLRETTQGVLYFGSFLERKSLELDAIFLSGAKIPLLEETFMYAPTQTYLNKNSILTRAITSHLQTSCCTVVVGTNEYQVNKMINSLLLFSPNNCSTTSRLLVKPSLKQAPPTVPRPRIDTTPSSKSSTPKGVSKLFPSTVNSSLIPMRDFSQTKTSPHLTPNEINLSSPTDTIHTSKSFTGTLQASSQTSDSTSQEDGRNQPNSFQSLFSEPKVADQLGTEPFSLGSFDSLQLPFSESLASSQSFTFPSVSTPVNLKSSLLSAPTPSTTKGSNEQARLRKGRFKEGKTKKFGVFLKVAEGRDTSEDQTSTDEEPKQKRQKEAMLILNEIDKQKEKKLKEKRRMNRPHRHNDTPSVRSDTSRSSLIRHHRRHSLPLSFLSPQFTHVSSPLSTVASHDSQLLPPVPVPPPPIHLNRQQASRLTLASSSRPALAFGLGIDPDTTRTSRRITFAHAPKPPNPIIIEENEEPTKLLPVPQSLLYQNETPNHPKTRKKRSHSMSLYDLAKDRKKKGLELIQRTERRWKRTAPRKTNTEVEMTPERKKMLEMIETVLAEKSEERDSLDQAESEGETVERIRLRRVRFNTSVTRIDMRFARTPAPFLMQQIGSKSINVICGFVPGLSVQGIHSSVAPRPQSYLRSPWPVTIVDMTSGKVHQINTSTTSYSALREKYIQRKMAKDVAYTRTLFGDTSANARKSSRRAKTSVQKRQPPVPSQLGPNATDNRLLVEVEQPSNLVCDIIIDCLSTPSVEVRSVVLHNQLTILIQNSITAALALTHLRQETRVAKPQHPTTDAPAKQQKEPPKVEKEEVLPSSLIFNTIPFPQLNAVSPSVQKPTSPPTDDVETKEQLDIGLLHELSRDLRVETSDLPLMMSIAKLFIPSLDEVLTFEGKNIFSLFDMIQSI